MARPFFNPKMIRWACNRSGYDREVLEKKFKRLPDWESGKFNPTAKQLTNFARAVHVPYAFLFLNKPPKESIPIPDFRTLENKQITRPSPNLLDVIYVTQTRQEWYRDYAVSENLPVVDFIDSASINSSPQENAHLMQKLMNFNLSDRKGIKNIFELQKYLVKQMEDIGILVMISSIVGSNSKRKLNVDEFRGFVLCDSYAPLIFVNGSDSISAQMFTLAHEIGHLLLGTSALSNVGIQTKSQSNKQEIWCNRFAAEFLVPILALKELFLPDQALETSVKKLSGIFKVSNLVILRRLLDAGLIERTIFNQLWNLYSSHVKKNISKSQSGGNFYFATLKRVNRKFAESLIVNTLEGNTSYRDALRMLGISSLKAFDGLAKEIGVS